MSPWRPAIGLQARSPDQIAARVIHGRGRNVAKAVRGAGQSQLLEMLATLHALQRMAPRGEAEADWVPSSGGSDRLHLGDVIPVGATCCGVTGSRLLVQPGADLCEDAAAFSTSHLMPQQSRAVLVLIGVNQKKPDGDRRLRHESQMQHICCNGLRPERSCLTEG